MVIYVVSDGDPPHVRRIQLDPYRIEIIIETDRQTDRQTDRERERDRQTDRHREFW